MSSSLGMLKFAVALLLAVNVLIARDIRIKGEAEVQVRPDHVVLRLGVETWNRELGEARDENDRVVESVKQAARDHSIANEDIVVDFAHVEIQRNQQLRTVVDHYTVQRVVVLTLRDVERFEEVLMSELDAGANHIHHIDFRTSELRRFADEARALALKAAYEKARDLASVGGFTVSEQPSDVFSANTDLKTWYSVSPSDNRAIRAATSAYQNIATAYNPRPGASGSDWVAPNSGVGYLSVRAELDLEFAIQEAE